MAVFICSVKIALSPFESCAFSKETTSWDNSLTLFSLKSADKAGALQAVRRMALKMVVKAKVTNNCILNVFILNPLSVEF